MTVAQYEAGMKWLTEAYEADHGAGSAAILPPGFLQMILTFLMSLLSGGGCLPPTPAPTPASVKAAAAANVGYIEAKCIMAIGFSSWRHHGRTTLASALKAVAAMDESPTGLLAQAIDDVPND